MIDIKKMIACPNCRQDLNPKKTSGTCPCGFKYRFKDGIWELLYTQSSETKNSQRKYEKMHRKVFDGPTDGSYEILGKIAKGNKCLDIACGDGFIEKYAPETVALEFSKNALLNAKDRSAKYLILADAQHLPFKTNAFDVSISTGNVEQFADPAQAIFEMVRVSKIQFLTAHREFNFPLAPLIRNVFTFVLGLKNQPIEKPIKDSDLEKMLKDAGARIIYKGLWTIPVNHGKVIKQLPEFKNIPACSFFVSIKND